MLELHDIGVRYASGRGSSARSTEALARVNLSLPAGRLLVILGPSGCGKSTLLNVVAGFVAPTSGTVRLDGREIHGPGADRGVVFQDDALLPWLDVLGNAAFPLVLRGLPRAEREAIARRSLARVGLQDFESHSVWELSGGMRQRVGIARALSADPAVLLMDEPFGALDEITRNRLDADLLELWQRKKLTVVFVTHSIHEAVYLSSRVVVMAARPGRVVEQLEIDEPYPRGPQWRVSQRFAQIAEHLQDSLLKASSNDEDITA